ncbi:MAG: hypothetical protein IPP07_07830 [Holophagales bacterium]|nr:hypothetical protein [Holophagales bacterium]
MGTTGETRVLLCAKDAIKAARQHVPLDFAIDFALHSEDSDDLSVRTSRAVLTLALFNLLLNALQQIALFRLRPGRVLLRTVLVMVRRVLG